ncbi:MAG: hypothetical protein HY062_10300 [Bacteroidetes bacterium]|nr:hypothetical protein [Bacteroidota bacterium]
MEHKTLHINSLLNELENYLLKNSKLKYVNYPLFRAQLGYYLNLLETNKILPNSSSPKIAYPIPIFNYRSLFQLLKLKVILFFLKINHKNLLKNKVLIYGFKAHYYKQKNGEEINLYLSPIKKELLKNGCGFEELLIDRNKPVNYDLSSLAVFYGKLKQYNRLLFAYRNKRINKIEKYISNSKFIKIFLDEKKIEQTDHFINLSNNFQIEQEINYYTFKELLKVTRPKLIWSYCFYENSVMALSRAANELAIENIEYQHSQQSDEHFAYARWENSDMYKEFFPKTFWVWKQSDADRLIRNFSGKMYTPRVIVGGNLSIIQQKEQFVAKEADADTGILVSLQGVWIPDFMERLIAQDQKYVWYFRLHPRYPDDKQKLIDLKQRFPDKIEIDQANALPLYELFAKVRFNITDFSGVALEAKEFDIDNIIIGRKGYTVYKTEIETETFFSAFDINELSKILYDQSITNKESKDTVGAARKKLDSILKGLYTN